MKSTIGIILGIGLLGCLAQAGPRPEAVKPATPERQVEVIGVDPEFREHFYDLLTNRLPVESDSLTITESGSDKWIVLNTGDELHVHLLVEDGSGGYISALHFATIPEFSVAEGEEVELPTRVISMDADVLMRAERIENIRKAVADGESLHSIVEKQAALQAEASDAAGTGTIAADNVDCGSAGSDTFCCGFIVGTKVRIICICHKGSGIWEVCFDTDA